MVKHSGKRAGSIKEERLSLRPTDRPVGGGVVVAMTRRDRERTLEDLVRVRAGIDSLNQEIAKLSTDEEDQESAVYASKQGERVDLIHRERQLMNLLSNVEEVKGRSDVTSIGSTVLLEFPGKQETRRLTISQNGDIAVGRVSPEAPIAQALLEANQGGGAKVGDTVIAGTPSGPLEMKVLEITVKES